MLRRLIVMTFGFLIASGVGAVFLVVSALFDPATREAGLVSVMTGLFALVDDALDGVDPGQALSALGFVIWAVIVATCAAPLAIAALIGEVAGARSFVWYSGVSGLLAGASPWIARAARGLERAQSVSEAEGRLALLFFLTGALTGAIYWLIAAPAPRPASAAQEIRAP
jgi:CBS domain containing-hemolysin-like protein